MVDTIIMICIFGGLVILCMGLSYLSQCYKALDYNMGGMSTDSYDANPLVKLGSKYYHWRPKGAVVVSKSQWEKIEHGISLRIDEAKDKGKELGRSELMLEIHQKLEEKKGESEFPKNPYVVLGISSNASDSEVDKAYQMALALYDPKLFQRWDSAFCELAKIRQGQIKKAYNKIAAGVAPVDVDKSKSISKGTF